MVVSKSKFRHDKIVRFSVKSSQCLLAQISISFFQFFFGQKCKVGNPFCTSDQAESGILMSKPEIVFLTMKEMNLARKSQCSRITLKKIVCWNAELNKLLKNVDVCRTTIQGWTFFWIMIKYVFNSINFKQGNF